MVREMSGPKEQHGNAGQGRMERREGEKPPFSFCLPTTRPFAPLRTPPPSTRCPASMRSVRMRGCQLAGHPVTRLDLRNPQTTPCTVHSLSRLIGIDSNTLGHHHRSSSSPTNQLPRGWKLPSKAGMEKPFMPGPVSTQDIQSFPIPIPIPNLPLPPPLSPP